MADAPALARERRLQNPAPAEGLRPPSMQTKEKLSKSPNLGKNRKI
jgi:hypothetical protein